MTQLTNQYQQPMMMIHYFMILSETTFNEFIITPLNLSIYLNQHNQTREDLEVSVISVFLNENDTEVLLRALNYCSTAAFMLPVSQLFTDLLSFIMFLLRSLVNRTKVLPPVNASSSQYLPRDPIVTTKVFLLLIFICLIIKFKTRIE